MVPPPEHTVLPQQYEQLHPELFVGVNNAQNNNEVHTQYELNVIFLSYQHDLQQSSTLYQLRLSKSVFKVDSKRH